MKEKGVSSVVVIAIVIIIAAVGAGGYLLLKSEGEGEEEEGPAAGVMTLKELNLDFDNTTLEFKSYGPGDIVQVQDTVENVMLVTRDELDEEVASSFEATYEVSFPVTLIMVESVENMEGQWVYTAIALEGDKRNDYEIGQEATISMHIEKVLGVEIAQEAFIGTMLDFWIGSWFNGGGAIPPSVSLSVTAENVGDTIVLTIMHDGGDTLSIADIELIADNSATTQYEANLDILTTETYLGVGHSIEVSYPADLDTGDTITVILVHLPSSQLIYYSTNVHVE